MRDPARIRRVLAKLERYWVQHPDLRLGQILGNALPGNFGNDPYHWEDTEFEKWLDEQSEQYSSQQS